MSKHRHKSRSFSEGMPSLNPMTAGLNKPSYMQPSAGDPYVAVEDTTNDPRFKVSSVRPFLPEIVTRSTVWDYYRTVVFLPNPSLILTKLGRGIEEFDQLLADARVKACLNNRRAGSLCLKWTIDANDADQRVVDTIQAVFDKLPIYEIMAQMLQAIFYGYQVCEVNWTKNNNMILPDEIVGKASRWFVYDDLNRLRYRTKVNMTQGEILPPRKFVVTRYHPDYADPYSGNESIAGAIYWPVKFRHMSFKFATNFIERYATPWIDLKHETGLQQERLAEMLTVISNTFQDGIVAHPDNTQITPLTSMSDSRSIDNYTSFIDTCNREIDMAILGNNLTSEVKGGSFAAASAHMGVRDDIIQEDSRMIEESFNQVIGWICWYNFNVSGKLPLFKLYKHDPADKDRAEIDVMTSKLGVKLKKEYFVRVYGYNENEFDIGEPVQDLAVGEKGEVAGAEEEGIKPKTGVRPKPEATPLQKAAKLQKQSIDALVNSQDQSTNNDTLSSVERAQKKGYSYSEATT